MLDTLYKEEILEHFHDPQNFGEIKDYTSKSKQLNPFCGDEIEIFVKLGTDSGQSQNDELLIEEISFTGKGCAISIASASMLTEEVKKKTTDEIVNFSEKDMLDLLGVEISETRKKCALLALAVLRDVFKSLRAERSNLF